MSKQETQIQPVDKQFLLILRQFKESATNPNEKGGRPPELTSETFLTLLNSLQNGLDREESCRASHFGLTTFYSYMGRSDEFKKAIERAEDFPNVAAEIAIVKAITGTPSRKMKVMNRSGDLVEIDTEEVPANIETAKWWLERVKKHKFATNPSVLAQNTMLGAPKTEKEASLMATMLKSLIDHAKRTAKTNQG